MDVLDVESPRSRKKEDIFHWFDALPLPKSSEYKAPLCRLLIHGTFQFVEDDFLPFVEFLVSKRNVCRDELLEHFYFNRELWRRHVRMPVYPADQHATNIRKIHAFVAEHLASEYTSEIKKYFDSFERQCREGKFSELRDVDLYRHIGVNINGLDVWLRLRGTIRAENIHQKMRVAMGPWKIGAATAHYLLVLLCYKYNINAGIGRCARPSFGHIYVHYIDRLQIAIQDIYNVIAYPRHFNISLFEPMKDHVAVGIGPLTYSEKYVQPGPPLPCLRGDDRFIAHRMRLECAPTTPSTKEELIIVNEHFKAHPNSSSSNMNALAIQFKQLVNGVTIFPKLPAQLHQYYHRWRANSLVKVALQSMNVHGYENLLNELASRVSASERLIGFDRAQIGTLAAYPSLQQLEQTAIAFDANRSALAVPPLAAPEQQHRVAFTRMETQISRRCYYAPHCEKSADQCGGYKAGYCTEVSQGRVAVNLVEFATSKEQRLRAEKAERQRKKRRAGP
jgi:hypothetical protein